MRKNGYPLQGLANLPLGLFLVAIAAYTYVAPAGSELRANFGGDPVLVLFVLTSVGSLIMRARMYNGDLPPSPYTSRLVPAVIFVGLMVALAIDVFYHNDQGSLTGLLTGLYFLIFGRRFVTHIVGGLVLMLVSYPVPFAFNVNVSPTENPLMLALIGCVVIIGSIYEHIVFVERDGAKTAAA